VRALTVAVGQVDTRFVLEAGSRPLGEDAYEAGAVEPSEDRRCIGPKGRARVRPLHGPFRLRAVAHS
jgi:hypothetical protein